ncbi:lysine-ketoglutarate reductase/saccharopine dehydrogenase-like protein (TIGR00300 family) [Methanolinea mesophila]|uniref:ornithine cyclodeaminase n=1 Tax=Methanolinea mesophila TaxID=547055 RepID=UPI001AE3396E|nr:TIGR00300 family protein [Methanolinea mesophila]MBP1927825.1 lysine-ketoglutarate reductase/saccharopine dehydrogenase-like protein (TIGR00300 family) [Methanolinea mesophila]
MQASREVELEGHIIDSGIMTRVFDRIMDLGGNFEIVIFDVGKRKTDPSYARLRVNADDDAQLDQILSEIHRFGARLLEIKDVAIVPAEGNSIVPKGFYSTTHHPTLVKFRGEWLPVQWIEMDCLIVVDPGAMAARCTPLSKLKKGDCVVVGETGVKVVPPERPRKVSTFEFMHGTVSPERPSETIISQIASEILEIRRRGERIALVGGPAIIHTGADRATAELVRKGYINVLLAGNALATHDIEYNLFGTSLGMNMCTGKPVTGGHKHHLYAISEVMRAGSIRKAVENGVITGGIMYECVKNDVPFVLAGSIRDDGPLPDVITDVMVAQDRMREEIKDVGLVLMVATLLHSVAVGNCLPSYVKTICVDINPSSVTKLMDRGTMQAIGVVSDAGTFLPLLLKQLDLQSGETEE